MRPNVKEPELTALLIAPDRDLAAEFASALPQARAFQIISELKSYPSEQTLGIRLRQVRPDVVIVDAATDISGAGAVIRMVAANAAGIHVVGLDRKNDPQVLLSALRAGATEFLHSPFDSAVQQEAAARLRRMRQPEVTVSSHPGSIAVFASAKPGSGASTLAAQTAFALGRASEKKVLLADFDLCRGMLGFLLHLSPPSTMLDALANADELTSSLWSNLVAESAGVDVLCAPEVAYSGPIDSAKLHALMGYARLNYDWVIIDLPVIFQRVSLMTLSNADVAYLVTTSELPSLHLARKAVQLLEQLGFPKDRFQMLVNRVAKRSGIGIADMEKLFSCTVHASIPQDLSAVNRAITRGEAIDPHCDLGKAIGGLASRISGKEPDPKPKAAVGRHALMAQIQKNPNDS